MTLSRKERREITGYTFSKIGSDPENWIMRAIAFKDAADKAIQRTSNSRH